MYLAVLVPGWAASFAAGYEDSRGVYFNILSVVPQWAKNRDTRALSESGEGCGLSALADGDGVVVVHQNALIGIGDRHGAAVRRSGNLSRELAFTLGGVERSAVGLRVGGDGGRRKQGKRQYRQRYCAEFSHDALLMPEVVRYAEGCATEKACAFN